MIFLSSYCIDLLLISILRGKYHGSVEHFWKQIREGPGNFTIYNHFIRPKPSYLYVIDVSPVLDCNSPLGMESRAIPDAYITASSEVRQSDFLMAKQICPDQTV